jgi:hypothetical protein
MNLEDHPRAIRWLNQFDTPDVPLARLVLRSLKLISHDEFEQNLNKLVLQFIEKGKPPIALFPIRKPSNGRKREGEKRAHFSSADRIGHFLENMERVQPNRIRVSPTIKSMRAEKTDLIILIDDIIGSGKRVTDFWRESLDPSIKSWLSYKKCKLFIATYAAHPKGLLRVVNSIRYFRQRQSLIFSQKLPKRVRAWDHRVEKLCKWYGKKTSKPEAALGYRDVMCPIVFQHGCPNDAPVILWSGGRSWEALFPNRAVPSEFYECFGAGQGADTAEILWRSGQYRLGLQILEAIEMRNLEDSQIMLLTVLGLLLRGVRSKALTNWLMLTESEKDGILQTAKNSSLIDDANSVTPFGRDLVERFRRIRTSQDKMVLGNEISQRFYYPQRYRGVPAKI